MNPVAFTLAIASWWCGGPYTLQPPPHVAALIERVKAGPDAAALAALAKVDRAAPWLRTDLGPVPGQRDFRPDLRFALNQIEARIDKRTSARFDAWLSRGRFDLCADALIECRNDALALDFDKRTWPARREAAAVWSPHASYGSEYESYREDRTHESGASVKVGPLARAPFVRAGHLDADAGARWSWTVFARRVRESDPMGNGIWEDSFVVVNGDLKVSRLRNCFIICDGSVELGYALEGCVIVANGDIVRPSGNGSKWSLRGGKDGLKVATHEPGPFAPNFLAAKGEFRLGKVPIGDAKPDVPSKIGLPFPVRFFDPREVGIVVGVKDGPVHVAEVSADSLMARGDVRVGDVVRRVDDVEIDDSSTFRRMLRRGIVRESVVLHLTRAGRPITRVLFFDDIPTIQAPPPRPMK